LQALGGLSIVQWQPSAQLQSPFCFAHQRHTQYSNRFVYNTFDDDDVSLDFPSLK
jgi:hypothetical protein